MIASYLGLGDEEPDEDEHAQAEAGEGDEGPISTLAHGHKHIRDGARNDEIEEPLSCCRKRHIECSESCRWNFRHIDPTD